MSNTEPKVVQSELPISSNLYPLYKVEGHGAHWKPVMEDAFFAVPTNILPARVLIITRHVFPEQQFRLDAERYIEIIRIITRLPGGYRVSDDIFSKIPVTTQETIALD